MMISYAQNFEDVILSRVFKDIERGFYIDVGANDPCIDSVTKHFYDKGWHGVNIEPLKSHFDDLENERTRDINLNIAISNEKGTFSLWETEIRGWATLDADTALRHEENGYKGFWRDIKSDTLERVCDNNVVSNDIHFLKVDVEGFEKQVLESADFIKYRPWVILVESTVAGSEVENFDKWESILISNNYTFVYFDGLNRFYLSNDKLYLKDRFRCPINIYDNFITIQHYQALLDVNNLHSELLRSENDLKEMKNYVNSLHSSIFWKLLYPIRLIIRFIRKIMRICKCRVLFFFNKLKGKIVKLIYRLLPKLFIYARYIEKVSPRIYSLLLSIRYNLKKKEKRILILNNRSAIIYDELKSAIERKSNK
ncbi:FkbM family methyltransferase [Vibrio rhizosphaerae]|uniref:FkbM family methyltransferase n=1 Tax=Vibrio rhizosphaerae TaxID=398736 RepID=A0ABU4IQ85_9VIBR|nr:FkbM family methyltransferase [Vibrio rhizosphaerae]MDW6091562.1 FkbM family methyltransferase [Vibrio rhizosphaerae]